MSKSEHLTFSISIDKKKTIRNFVLVLTICFVLGLTYFLHHTEPDLKTSELVKVTTGALVLIGLIYSIMTYELAQKKNRSDQRMQKMASTYNACSQFYSKDIIEHCRVLSNFEKTADFNLIRTDVVSFNSLLNNPEQAAIRGSLVNVVYISTY